MTPLLELISQYTGLPILSLIAGSPPQTPGEDYRVVGVHVGQSLGPIPLNFAQYDPAAYRDLVLGTFANFLSSTSSK